MTGDGLMRYLLKAEEEAVLILQQQPNIYTNPGPDDYDFCARLCSTLPILLQYEPLSSP